MTAPVFIGDEVTAAGYRLAGAQTLSPEPGTVLQAFADALDDAEFVIITAAFAAELPQEHLNHAMRRADPMVLVVADAANAVTPADLSDEVDRVLGIER